MAIPIVGSPQAQPATPVQEAAARQAATTQKKHPPQTDTVTISAAAKDLQQRTEAPPRVINAAAAGDVQAKAQLARPIAAPATK